MAGRVGDWSSRSDLPWIETVNAVQVQVGGAQVEGDEVHNRSRQFHRRLVVMSSVLGECERGLGPTGVNSALVVDLNGDDHGDEENRPTRRISEPEKVGV